MSSTVYRLLWLSYGILNPVYNSYKTIKDKNVKEYVRLMMYWVVFAMYSFFEVFGDFFLSWLPFYFEAKIVTLLWLVLPLTKGTTLIYTKCLHTALLNREKEIDIQLDRMKGYCFDYLVYIGSKGFSLFSNLVITATIKGQTKLADHLRSISLNDLTIDDSVSYHSDKYFTEAAYRQNKTTAKRNLLRYHTISTPTIHSELETVNSKSEFHAHHLNSKMSVVPEHWDIVYSNEDNSVNINERIEYMKEQSTNEMHECLDTTPTIVHPQPSLVDCQPIDVTPSKINRGETSKSTESVLNSSLEYENSGNCDKVDDISSENKFEVNNSNFNSTQPSATEIQPRSEATPTTKSPIKSPESPPIKLSGFTKTNFLKSLNFFDKKGSK